MISWFFFRSWRAPDGLPPGPQPASWVTPPAHSGTSLPPWPTGSPPPWSEHWLTEIMQQYPLVKLLFSNAILSLFTVIIILDLSWTEQSNPPGECCEPRIHAACTSAVDRGCWWRSRSPYPRHRSRSSKNSLLTFSKIGEGGKSKMDVFWTWAWQL